MTRVPFAPGKRTGSYPHFLSESQIEHLCDGDLAQQHPELRRDVTLEQVLKSAFPGLSF
ncbi:MAG: hypothetical protein GX436_04830 [Synergistaceae bacterium]|nr:hypothetical protein [Synergistaceae bacterium]